MAPADEHVFSAYGMSLVVASTRTDRTKTNYDMCLFASNVPREISDNTALAAVVADLFQSGMIYHAIQHPVSPTYPDEILWHDQIWNLPTPYRPSTAKHSDILDWLEELHGLHLVASQNTVRNDDDQATKEEDDEEGWDRLQLLLYFLNEGQSYSLADLCRETVLTRCKSRIGWYQKLDEHEKESRARAGVRRRCDTEDGRVWLPPKCSTKGDSDEPAFED